MADEKLPPDGGCRAYTVVFASFLCNGLVFGIVNSYSIIFTEIKSHFEKQGLPFDSAKVSLIGSLTLGTTFLLSMASGMLSDRIGIRLTTFLGGAIVTSSMLLSSFFTEQISILFVTYGILFGIGASLTYVPSLTIIGHYFKKYIGIANGLVTVGSSTFSIMMPYVLDFLMLNVGLDKCFRYVGSLLSILMLCSIAFKPMYKSSSSKKNSDEENNGKLFANFLNLNIWKNKKYVLWVIAVPIALWGYFVPYVFMKDFVQAKFPESDYKLPLVCIPIASGIGRLIFGPLSDVKKVNSIFLQQLSFFMIGIVSILIPLTSNFNVLLLLNLILGLFDGCFITVIGPIAFHLCGPKGASQAIGFILGLCSLPIITGPPIAGWIYDQTKSYTLPFILAGIPPLFGALLLTKIHFMDSIDQHFDELNSLKVSERKQLTKNDALKEVQK